MFPKTTLKLAEAARVAQLEQLVAEPERNDTYYNYYAAMALHHAGGPEWTTWNAQMREQLVQTQIKSGPAAGSWPVTDPHGQLAGQIYQTALAVLTLEVYYHYLPLYRNGLGKGVRNR